MFLRTPRQKKQRDVFQGCIFLCGWRKIYGKEFQLIADEPEASPVDVIAVVDEPNGSSYIPFQLKQLPTRSQNPNINLGILLARLAKDPKLADTLVAVYLNRAFHSKHFLALSFSSFGPTHRRKE